MKIRIGVLALLLHLGCSPVQAPPTDDLLYVWAFDTERKASDFLAVLEPDGTLVDTVPVGLAGGAHHTEHRMPDGNTFFANAFSAGTTFRFDVTDPRSPRVAGSFGGRGAYTFPHSFERLDSGNVLATFQNRGDENLEPGGLVELDPEGNYIRGGDAADPADPELRPYSLAILPEIDRVVTSTADMRGTLLGSSVQIWRLSDLQLLKTLVLPAGERGDENVWPAEPRVLSDGKTVVVNTFSCGLYAVSAIDSDAPEARLVHAFPYEPPHRCALSALIGDVWVQAVPTSEALVSLSVRDPQEPEVLDTLKLGDDYRPHWIAADRAGRRIVATGRGEMRNRVVVVNIDRETGALSHDPIFREEGSSAPGVSFDRASWPHGPTGAATPHGAIFYR